MLRDNMLTSLQGRLPGPLKEIVEDLPQVDANRAREGADHEKVEQGGGRRQSSWRSPERPPPQSRFATSQQKRALNAEKISSGA
jgi:hypothetical protein